MKKLYILRHAKAGQTNKNILDDHERPLTEKGINQCRLLGEYLKNNDAAISYIISSTSRRTQETTELTLGSFGTDVPVEYISKIYLGSTGDLLSEINAIDDSNDAAMIVGHSPGLHQLALSLIKTGDKGKIRDLANSYPPGSLAVIEFPSESWAGISPRSGELIDFLITKKIAA